MSVSQTPGERKALVIGIVSLILMGIPAWDVLEKRGWSTLSMLTAVGWLLGAGLLVWSVTINVRDANRAESLRSQILTIKEEHKLEIHNLENKRLKEVNRLTSKMQVSETNFHPTHTLPSAMDLETTILNGYVGTLSESDRNTEAKSKLLLVMLEIMVSGKGHRKISSWDLQLRRPDDGSVWMPANQLRFRMTNFTSLTPKQGKLLPSLHEVYQVRQDVPVDSGFVLFAVPGAADLTDYIFGTQFEIFGREERGIMPCLRSEPKPASEWLIRATFSFVGEEA